MIAAITVVVPQSAVMMSAWLDAGRDFSKNLRILPIRRARAVMLLLDAFAIE
jgi:hypothetical protein